MNELFILTYTYTRKFDKNVYVNSATYRNMCEIRPLLDDLLYKEAQGFIELKSLSIAKGGLYI